MAATISVLKTEREMNNKVTVTLLVKTSIGKLEVPVKMGDPGSAQAQEDEARRQLRTLCEEVLDAL